MVSNSKEHSQKPNFRMKPERQKPKIVEPATQSVHLAPCGHTASEGSGEGRGWEWGWCDENDDGDWDGDDEGGIPEHTSRIASHGSKTIVEEHLGSRRELGPRS